KIDRRGAVARLTLSRPERANALNAAMLGEINAALDALERDGDVRVLIVTGAGAAFSSGFDLKEQMERRPAGVEQWRAILRRTSTLSCASGISRARPSRRCVGHASPAPANWRSPATLPSPPTTPSSASRN